MVDCLNTSQPNIIVFGDLMLDVNLYGSTNKIANEAPTPVLNITSKKAKLGGCGNVLMNLESLGCSNLFLFSMVGNDIYADKIQKILGKHSNITPYLYLDDTYQTTVKTRGFANKTLMFRYDIEKYSSLRSSHITMILSQLISVLDSHKINSIVLSDYNKGFLKDLAQEVIRIANEYGVPTYVDPKVDYSKYVGCTVFKPNIKEIYDIFNLQYSFESLREIHETVRDKLGCQETLITLSENGMSMLTSDTLLYEPAVKTEVNDVTGAGDIVLAIFAYYTKMEREKLIKLATYIGTQSVKWVGTYLIRPRDILEAHRAIHENKLITVDKVKYITSPIVFTNGCFDILHEGHLALFKYCKSVRESNGCVIVALNSDESIKGLKGPSRPINKLDSRIAMLNEIDAIDWIVVFTEDTPYKVLQEIRPDVLVKGGDYTVDSVIGREFCRDVKIFDYMRGKSTTNIIEKIQKNLNTSVSML